MYRGRRSQLLLVFANPTPFYSHINHISCVCMCVSHSSTSPYTITCPSFAAASTCFHRSLVAYCHPSPPHHHYRGGKRKEGSTAPSKGTPHVMRDSGKGKEEKEREGEACHTHVSHFSSSNRFYSFFSSEKKKRDLVYERANGEGKGGGE